MSAGARSVFFERIRVENATDIGMKLEEVQNSFLADLQVEKSTNYNRVMDYTCRTISFYDCGFSGYGVDGVIIRHSGAPAHAGGPRCSKIHFYGGIIERAAGREGFRREQ